MALDFSSGGSDALSSICGHCVHALMYVQTHIKVHVRGRPGGLCLSSQISEADPGLQIQGQLR